MSLQFSLVLDVLLPGDICDQNRIITGGNLIVVAELDQLHLQLPAEIDHHDQTDQTAEVEHALETQQLRLVPLVEQREMRDPPHHASVHNQVLDLGSFFFLGYVHRLDCGDVR